ncbi:MAG: UDP-2,3-diacylglucosamine diphosphatase [Betaproteobacteria bacterium]
MASSLFVSDLHLSEERPEANERFIAFIEDTARSAAALYVLGDLFEYWIGDDDLGEPFNAVMSGFFANLVRAGVPVHLMHGNRDFLMGERFCRATGARLLADPAVLEVGGVKTLLMHGDTLCTDDLDYQGWRRTARSPAWQREFLAQPLEARRRAVGALREKSREVIQVKPAEIMDVNEAAVRDAFRRHGVTRLIHGHTHRPGRHELEVDGRRCERWVLPDWYGRGGYLDVSAAGPRLVRW